MREWLKEQYRQIQGNFKYDIVRLAGATMIAMAYTLLQKIRHLSFDWYVLVTLFVASAFSFFYFGRSTKSKGQPIPLPEQREKENEELKGRLERLQNQLLQKEEQFQKSVEYAQALGREVTSLREQLAEKERIISDLQGNASVYDTPIWKAVLFIADLVEEPQDGNHFPQSRNYIRQLALDGRLTLWGRRQLEPTPPFKEQWKFSDIWTEIPKEYWVISKLTAHCMDEKWDNRPWTLEEEKGKWPTPANGFTDIRVNWEQVKKLMPGKDISPTKLSIARPRIVPVAYEKPPGENAPGLIIGNEGEPAHGVCIPDVQLGSSIVRFTLRHTRLAKEDLKVFCEVTIERTKNHMIVGGGCLVEELTIRDIGGIDIQISYTDNELRPYLTNCKLRFDPHMPCGIAAVLAASDTGKGTNA